MPVGLLELAVEEDDLDVLQEVEGETRTLTEEGERFELEALLCGETDASNAIIHLQPGAGGTESQDWTEMLMRMYMRWVELHGHGIEVLEVQPGEEAGIKSVTLKINGTVRVRIPQGGKRRAPSGAHLAFRRGQAPPYVVRFGPGFPRG